MDQNITDTSLASSTSKLTFLALRLQSSGVPLHLALDQIPFPSHRAALASFICTDRFLGKFAQNYFARNLVPRLPRHIILARDAGVDCQSVCLSCWHFRREVFLEDELHVVCVCPEYRRARQELLNSHPPAHGLASYQALTCPIILRLASKLVTGLQKVPRADSSGQTSLETPVRILESPDGVRELCLQTHCLENQA